jgi:hypothetical protein
LLTGDNAQNASVSDMATAGVRCCELFRVMQLMQ